MMKGALPTPIWFNEFTAGGSGFYGTKGRARMWAYIGLIDGAQGLLAWTFNSHVGGEEQALFGLVDHEYTVLEVDGIWLHRIGIQKTSEDGFSVRPHPPVAIAYSFESRTASNPINPSNSNSVKQYVTTPYMEQEQNAFAPLFKDNIDVAVINIGHEDLSPYKMVVVPGDYLMDQASADALRRYVRRRRHGDHDRILAKVKREQSMVQHALAWPAVRRLRTQDE